MPYILTFIASSTPLSIAHLERGAHFAETYALGLAGSPQWLDPHVAADLPVTNMPTLEQMKALRAAFDAEKIDILCSNAAGRKKRLLVADMDATIVAEETLDELAGRAGLKDQIAAITDRAMRGDLDFAAALKERVSLLKGLPEAALGETLAETKLNPGAEKLVKIMGASGARCVLVSGGFSFFTKAVAQQCGFHSDHGNTLNIEGGVLAGTVGEPILGKEAKLSYLQQYVRETGMDMSETVAIGDGANDLPMLAAAGLGIGYRPKPLLEETLLNLLKYADLTGVLYAQGYKGVY